MGRSEKKDDIFQLGELNPIGSSAELLPDMSQPGAFLDLIAAAAKKIMSPISFKASRGTLGWKAVCLRVTTGPRYEDILMSAVRDRNTNKGVVTNDEYVIIKAYIPERNAACPLPRTLPAYNVEHEDHDWINKFFPTMFYASNHKHRTPVHGELIWVDYENPDTFEGGIYNGPVGLINPQIFFPNNGPLDSSKDAFAKPAVLAKGTISGAEPEPAPEVATPAVLKPPAKPVVPAKKPGINMEKMFGKKKPEPISAFSTASKKEQSKETQEILSEYAKNLKQVDELKEQGMSDYDAKSLVFGWD